MTDNLCAHDLEININVKHMAFIMEMLELEKGKKILLNGLHMAEVEKMAFKCTEVQRKQTWQINYDSLHGSFLPCPSAVV